MVLTRGKNRVVTVVASNSRTGKELYRVFIGLEIKDPIGTMIKNQTGTDGNLTRTFKIGDNGIGTLQFKPLYTKQALKAQNL